MAAIDGVRPNTPFWDKLQKDDCKTLAEFYKCAYKIMRPKTTREVIQAGNLAPTEKNGDDGKKQKNEDRHPSPKKATKKSKAPDLRVSQPPSSKLTNYTDLVSS